MEISIIIPIYNRAQFLPKCLDSVATQSFADWECLLIDDGSTDNGLAICQAYASKDERFKVFHQENRGVSSARNLGLDQVQGEYICFVDSDDYLHEDCLSSLYEAVGSSGLCCGGMTVRDKDGALRHINNFPSCVLSLCEDSQRSVFLDLDHTYLLNGPCNKLYRRSILEKHSIRFCENLSYGEDIKFNFDYFPYIESITVIDYSYYNVVSTDDSLSRNNEWPLWENYQLEWTVRHLFYQKMEWMQERICGHLGDIYGVIVLKYINELISPSLCMPYTDRLACVMAVCQGKGNQYLKYSSDFSWLKRFVLKNSYMIRIYFMLKYLKNNMPFIVKVGLKKKKQYAN